MLNIPWTHVSHDSEIISREWQVENKIFGEEESNRKTSVFVVYVATEITTVYDKKGLERETLS